MANCMKNIAEGLGVELDEVFRIDDYDIEIHGYYKITEQGLYVSSSNSPYNWEDAFIQDFSLLINGDIELTKLPQKPDIGATYYYPSPMFPCLWKWRSWKNDEVDNYRFQHGFVFTTPEEAIALAQRMMEVVKGKVKAND